MWSVLSWDSLFWDTGSDGEKPVQTERRILGCINNQIVALMGSVDAKVWITMAISDWFRVCQQRGAWPESLDIMVLCCHTWIFFSLTSLCQTKHICLPAEVTKTAFWWVMGFCQDLRLFIEHRLYNSNICLLVLSRYLLVWGCYCTARVLTVPL